MNTGIRRAAAVLGAGLTLAVSEGAAKDAVPPAPAEWLSTQLVDHPLAGKIWSARDGRIVSAGELAAEISQKPYVLLGEVHDNPDHHRLQAWAVTVAGKSWDGRRRAGRIAFEMLSEEQRAANARFFEDAPPSGGAPPFTAQDLARAVAWDKSGWPPFAIYEPVFGAALDHRLRIVAANPSRERTRALSAQGLAALGDVETRRLALDRPFAPEPETSAALAEELRESHCGLLPDKALGAMALVQRFRDAAMADALLSGAAAGAAAILVAGNGHARRDRGAPFYLERRGVAPDEIAVLMPIEVEEGKTDPGSYAPRAPDGALGADYLWFTPRHERPDPCEGLRKRLNGVPKSGLPDPQMK